MVPYTDLDQEIAEDVHHSSSEAKYKIPLRPTKHSPMTVSTSTTEVQNEELVAGIETHVRKLVANLESNSLETVRESTSELRLLAKDFNNLILVTSCGAITPLINLLYSSDLITQENAVTAVLNLSISNNNKVSIVESEAIEPLVHVLQTGTHEARENAAATLYSLSVFEENKIKIGNSGAIGALVELLGNGTLRGKKDAATALFYLSTCIDNRLTIIRSGAVKHLVDLMDPAAGMVDRAVVVLANLASVPEGRKVIAAAGGISLLVEAIELGSPRGKENAAAALVHFCAESNRYCRRVLEEGGVPPLVILSNSGTPRAKLKANRVLQHLRNLQAAYNARKR
ncbi:hypothetical protein SOVF_062190 [Spinacia oleracea]|uniref:RING-type E3 ubiquitin transferase n=1 Tax=Spinacia oleracea TaxID=3562 RepID=A0A9R0IQX9_SPIOL|nr:U-box domain-containing protein 4-like [Spinacia oleracea]XP_021853929.1 U-box domain-containing protein 4-like [Spinacia oleracea]KNA19373.1 hypothetical protein SOVF_062190 [Spinacia oleracea]